jgi:D-alanyl-lipoteichoic acid acyltransferase DltB (MBOAT superfamily)
VDAAIFLILWGYFKKVVVADNIGMIADNIFNNYDQFEGLPILFGVLAFTIQIYCDFSGYSDIARGVCKLLGFDLMVNFRLPYFALNPTDFWQRWHISLSSWLRDYLYISLGGNRGGPVRTYRNLFLTMLLGGLWHGAAWPFVLWGAYHGLILCAYRVLDRRPEHRDPWSGRYPHWRIVGKMMLMFVLTMIGWAIFRSQSMEQLLYIVGHVGVGSWDFEMAYKLALFGLPVVLMDLAQYRSGDLLVVTKQNYLVQGLVYGVLIAGIIVFGVRDSLEFIYFQF